MDDEERRERGLEKMREVYGGLVDPPALDNFFTQNMVDNLFGEVWTNGSMSIKDRRLVLIGIIAEKREPTTFKIQLKAALQNGEIDADEVWGLLALIANYCGYPNAAALILPALEAVGEVERERD